MKLEGAARFRFRLTWDKIKLDEEPPVVVLDQTKANHRRVNPIPKNALEWLKLLRGTGKLTPANLPGADEV